MISGAGRVYYENAVEYIEIQARAETFFPYFKLSLKNRSGARRARIPAIIL